MARYRFNFWLNSKNPDELQIAEEIENLKRIRLFAKTIRDGIRLICDLRRGSVAVLLELFPDVKEAFASGQSDIMNLIAQQTAILERLASQPVLAPVTPTKAAIGFSLPELPPVFVDDAPAVDPGTARANFAASMGDLFNQDESDLWD